MSFLLILLTARQQRLRYLNLLSNFCWTTMDSHALGNFIFQSSTVLGPPLLSRSLVDCVRKLSVSLSFVPQFLHELWLLFEPLIPEFLDFLQTWPIPGWSFGAPGLSHTPPNQVIFTVLTWIFVHEKLWIIYCSFPLGTLIPCLCLTFLWIFYPSRGQQSPEATKGLPLDQSFSPEKWKFITSRSPNLL